MADQSQPLNVTLIHAGAGPQEAVDLGHGIFMSRDISNAYRVVTPEGDVIVNTGIVFNEKENLTPLKRRQRQSGAQDCVHPEP
jgi:hypothetical protein